MISVSIMASKEREHFFHYLKDKLGDVPFSVDEPRKKQGNIGIWGNCKRAWGLHNPDAKYHLVIQDDAIITDDFYNKLNSLVEKVENKYPDIDFAYQLYFGELPIKPEELEFAKENGYFMKTQLNWGVAIMLPTKLIPDMVKFGNNYPSNEDDTKIKFFLMQNRIQTIYPYPCLIDHRRADENPTLTMSANTDRYSTTFNI